MKGSLELFVISLEVRGRGEAGEGVVDSRSPFPVWVLLRENYPQGSADGYGSDGDGEWRWGWRWRWQPREMGMVQGLPVEEIWGGKKWLTATWATEEWSSAPLPYAIIDSWGNLVYPFINRSPSYSYFRISVLNKAVPSFTSSAAFYSYRHPHRHRHPYIWDGRIQYHQ